MKKKHVKLFGPMIAIIILLWAGIVAFSEFSIQNTPEVVQLDFDSDFTTEKIAASILDNRASFSFTYEQGRTMDLSPGKITVEGNECEFTILENSNREGQTQFITGNKGIATIECTDNIEKGFNATMRMNLAYPELNNQERTVVGRLAVN